MHATSNICDKYKCIFCKESHKCNRKDACALTGGENKVEGLHVNRVLLHWPTDSIKELDVSLDYFESVSERDKEISTTS